MGNMCKGMDDQLISKTQREVPNYVLIEWRYYRRTLGSNKLTLSTGLQKDLSVCQTRDLTGVKNKKVTLRQASRQI